MLKRDPIDNVGSLSILDATSDFSWEKQAASVAGDTWLSKIGSNYATFNGPIVFSDGFQFTTAADDIIALPSQFQLATNEAERLIIAWFRHGTQPLSAGGGAGVLSCGTAAANHQYGIYCNLRPSAPDGPLYVTAEGGAVIHVVSNAPANDSLWQIGIHIKLVSGVYVYSVYVNGLLAGTYNRAISVLPAAGAARIGAHTGASTNWLGKFYRAVSDDLTGGSSAAALVAADYAAYKNVFV
ncbi:hypothetical protein D3C87_1469750 [compost metagenome]